VSHPHFALSSRLVCATITAMIQFQDVSYSVGSQPVIRNLSFEIREGETFVLLGRSGSGKTTSLKLINRLLEPASGTVLVRGKSTADWDPIELRRAIGYVIQEVGLFPHFTVEQNVGIVPSLLGWDAQRMKNRTSEVLNLVGLDPVKFATRYPHALSGGQRQRVGVARALAADPALLLFDEPFGALDPISRDEIQHEFHDLQQRLQKTIVFVTHDVGEALILGSRIALMEEGNLVAVAAAREFLRLEDSAVRKFLQPVRNIRELFP
jgi:osmoprotectant transport system ATP-binding protein